MGESLQTLFKALQQNMITEASFSDYHEHPTDKGDNTEACWIKWFNENLPNRYIASKAKVIDCEGNTSDQIDIVIYDGQYSYLAFNKNNVLYIPAESVYAVFEVKQVVNKSNIEYAEKKAASVRRLKRTSAPIPYAGGIYDPKEPPHIIAGVLARKTEWKCTFGSSFKRNIIAVKEEEQLDCGCILECGAFFLDKERRLKTSNEEESLVYFFLQLLILLQQMGTVPAIDLKEYMKALTIKEEYING